MKDRITRQTGRPVQGSARRGTLEPAAPAAATGAPAGGAHGHRFAALSILPAPAAAGAVVQRDGPSLKLGDWEIQPPKPTTETDDRYDTPENQRRAEMKEADERGKSATPNEWWKPKQPNLGPLGPYQDPRIWDPKTPSEAPPLTLPPWLTPAPAAGESPAPENVPLGPGDFPLPSGDERYA